MARGFASIGLCRPKHAENIGGVLRAATVYGAACVAIEGDRSGVKHCADTTKAWRHMPVFRGDDLFSLCPYGAVPVAVDLVEDAVELPDFRHPHAAFYVFGPEDGTLGAKHLSCCRHRVVVPGRVCMNLAAAVNVVLYDRMAKSRHVAPLVARVA